MDYLQRYPIYDLLLTTTRVCCPRASPYFLLGHSLHVSVTRFPTIIACVVPAVISSSSGSSGSSSRACNGSVISKISGKIIKFRIRIVRISMSNGFRISSVLPVTVCIALLITRLNTMPWQLTKTTLQRLSDDLNCLRLLQNCCLKLLSYTMNIP